MAKRKEAIVENEEVVLDGDTNDIEAVEIEQGSELEPEPDHDAAPPQPEYYQFDPVDPGAIVFYRTNDNISFNDNRAPIRRNRLITRRDVKNIDALRKRGALTEVVFDDPIDLIEVPNWHKRAVVLQKHGLTHVVQMLFYEPKAIAQVLDDTTTREVSQWQNELFQYLERLVCKPENG
jgi:hypothetical protein